MTMRLLSLVTTLWTLAVVTIVVLADTGAGPTHWAMVSALPGGDKLGHVGLMGTLALLATASLAPRTVRVGAWLLPLGTLLVFLAVTAEELSQLLVPVRTFDLRDLASDYVGIALGALLALRLYARLTPNRTSQEEYISTS